MELKSLVSGLLPHATKHELTYSIAVFVADAFIIKTYRETATEGAAEDDTAKPENIYLIEKLRTTSVMKFSGTLGSSRGLDQRTSTLSAFAHFVMQSSACQYLFADIQGELHPFYRVMLF